MVFLFLEPVIVIFLQFPFAANNTLLLTETDSNFLCCIRPQLPFHSTVPYSRKVGVRSSTSCSFSRVCLAPKLL